MWGGRFSGTLDERMARFNNSFPFDRRMWEEDIRGSQAWARQLARAGIIDADELKKLLDGLEDVRAEFATGTFAAQPGDEDIHTAVERRLGELAGAVAGKLHTGRSRNDQVATDVRLWTLGAIGRADAALRELQAALLAQAQAAGDALMPGYTHLQRAQPILLAHWLLAHFWPLERDRARLDDCAQRAAVLPLGSGALAGTPLTIDRAALAADLGFRATSPNSLDAVSDRDFVAESLFALTMVGLHLSRIGEEVVLWTSDEFGFLRLADAYSTGSSMLPQKKNPDIAELARGKAGRLIGDLTGFLATLKGLPLAYNRDLQEDKEPLFDALDQCRLALGAIAGLLSTAEVVHVRMQEAADGQHAAAVDLAEWLVQRGVPFREAHARVGALVRASAERGVPLDELVLTEPDLGPEALALLEPGAAVQRRTTKGGAGPASVAEQLVKARVTLDDQARWLDRAG
jgi:argininosuccinate lyase